MKVIIAGSYEEYVRCCHQNCLRVDATPFITKPGQIEDIRGPVEPIYFGKFWENPALEDIERVMHSRGIKVKGQYIER